MKLFLKYRVSQKSDFTLFLLFSRVLQHIQRNFIPFFNSPGNEDFKTHHTFVFMLRFDQITVQNGRQTRFTFTFFMADFDTV